MQILTVIFNLCRLICYFLDQAWSGLWDYLSEIYQITNVSSQSLKQNLVILRHE